MTLRTTLALAGLLLLAACNMPPQTTAAPSGISTTGSAGTTGGAARAPVNAGALSTTRP